MQIIDLSHPLFETMPVFPGAEPPDFEPVASINADGYAEMRMRFFSHTGTHLDVPSHVFQDGPSLGQLSVDRFAGSAVVLDFSSQGGMIIEIDDLVPNRHLFEQNDFVLLHTGWSRYWASDAYYSGYPVLSEAAAEWVIQFDLKGVGVDTVSVDMLQSMDLPVHRRLLQHRIIIVENLNRLHELPPSGFTFLAMPLPVRGGDGSPVRAIAIL
jgi:kynurenine formamidase